MVITSILFYSQLNSTKSVCSGIPLWMEGRGLLTAAVWWSLTLYLQFVPATIWAALRCSWRSMRWRLKLHHETSQIKLPVSSLELKCLVLMVHYCVILLCQQDRFDLELITWLGLSLSLVCLFICILTFSLIRSIQSPRTTIHLHLCISLFIAILIFLTCISRTENQVNTSGTAVRMPPRSRWVQ